MAYIPQPGTELSDTDIKEIIKENNVSLISLEFVDINGHLKNLSVPVKQIDKALGNEYMLDGSSIKGFRNIETSDMYFYPDKSTFALLPGQLYNNTKAARLICDIYNDDGTPFAGCPRCNLKRVIKENKEHGYVMNAGPEAEFFLFKRDADGYPTTKVHDMAGYYDVGPDDFGEEVRSEIIHVLENMGFETEASHHEVSHGQHEIDFKYADPLTTADNILTFKHVVKSTASHYGLFATFMPKPIFGVNGSGMHCNISLFKNGKNAFYSKTAPMQLSDEALWVIGGMLKNVKGFTAVTNPLVNSYKRIVPGFEAPVYLAWSPANRSALIRVPAKRGKSTRVELRSPDPSCNPYLAMAVMFASAMDGVCNKINAPLPAEGNIFHMTHAQRADKQIDMLPSSLKEALDCMENNEVVKNALGEHIFKEFMLAKRKEWDSYRTYVSQWELDAYLETF